MLVSFWTLLIFPAMIILFIIKINDKINIKIVVLLVKVRYAHVANLECKSIKIPHFTGNSDILFVEV